MNKSEFIDHIAQEHGCSKVEAEKVINAFTKSVTSALGAGEEVTLIGFGKFSTSQVAARQGRNPQTGKPLNIAAYVQPKFSAGKELKDACNGKANKKSSKNSDKAKDKNTASKQATISKNNKSKADNKNNRQKCETLIDN